MSSIQKDKHLYMVGGGSGNEGIVPPFLTLSLDGSKWSVSLPCSITAGETDPSAHCIGSWVATRAGLDGTEKRKISYPNQELNPDSLVVLAVPTHIVY
jgi:hypothetical protein